MAKLGRMTPVRAERIAKKYQPKPGNAASEVLDMTRVTRSHAQAPSKAARHTGKPAPAHSPAPFGKGLDALGDVVAAAQAAASSPTVPTTLGKREPKPGNTRYRRNEDELIRDLEAKVAILRLRIEQRSRIAATPSAKAAAKALRAIEAAQRICGAEGDLQLVGVLRGSAQPLQVYFKNAARTTEPK